MERILKTQPRCGDCPVSLYLIFFADVVLLLHQNMIDIVCTGMAVKWPELRVSTSKSVGCSLCVSSELSLQVKNYLGFMLKWFDSGILVHPCCCL